MASPRRLGSENSAIRASLIEAAAELLEESGFAGLTSRQIAERAGVKPQLIHYYFRTIDDLIVALTRRIGDAGLVYLAKAMTSDNPLRAAWQVTSNAKTAVVEMEVITAGLHHQRMRDEVVRFGEQARMFQTHAIAQYFERKGIEPPVPPVVIAFLMNAVRRMLATERAMGNAMGHREVIDVIEGWLNHMDKEATSAAQRSRAGRPTPPSHGAKQQKKSTKRNSRRAKE